MQRTTIAVASVPTPVWELVLERTSRPGSDQQVHRVIREWWTGVVVMTVIELATHNRLLLAVLAVGFVARVLTGPTLSPLGRLVTQVVRPRLAVEPRLVPGPPKRFAQGVGAVVTVSALALALLGAWTAAAIVLSLVLVFARLEAAVGFCMGCVVFRYLMRAGVIPEEICAECNDVWSRVGRG